jgi:hypothetical protein
LIEGAAKIGLVFKVDDRIPIGIWRVNGKSYAHRLTAKAANSRIYKDTSICPSFNLSLNPLACTGSSGGALSHAGPSLLQACLEKPLPRLRRRGGVFAIPVDQHHGDRTL